MEFENSSRSSIDSTESRQRSGSKNSPFIEDGNSKVSLQLNHSSIKKSKNTIETFLVYGHILEAVASFTCLLVLFNVIFFVKQNLNHILLNGALIYGFTVYVGILSQLISLLFLLIMVRTRFKYNQAGIPNSETYYGNFLLLSHIILGVHWFLVTLFLFKDGGYIDCFTIPENSFNFTYYRICDLIWLVKFLASLNLFIWTLLSSYIAIFINSYYLSYLLKWFPSLNQYTNNKEPLLNNATTIRIATNTHS